MYVTRADNLYKNFTAATSDMKLEELALAIGLNMPEIDDECAAARENFVGDVHGASANGKPRAGFTHVLQQFLATVWILGAPHT
jgi:hypothetical protein